MTEQFCKLQDITCVSATPFQSHYEARTTLPLAEILNDRFFNHVRDNLRVGDEIAICRYDRIAGSQQDTRLLEFCTARVSEKSADGVKLFVVQAPIDVAAAEAEAELAKPGGPGLLGPRYIEGNGEVRWNPGRKCYEIMLNGTAIVTDIPRDAKEKAQQMARGDIPLPAPLPEAA